MMSHVASEPSAVIAQPADSRTDDDVLVTPEEVEALIERMSLTAVRLVRWNGDSLPGTQGPVSSVDAALEPPRMRILPTEVSLWFEHRVECRNTDGDAIAEIETGVLVDFELSGDDEPELPVVACFADTNGAFIAWPYIREAVQTMSTRLGLAPIVLGVLRREA